MSPQDLLLSSQAIVWSLITNQKGLEGDGELSLEGSP